MKQCDKCDITLSGDLDKCPLCQAELTGEPEPSVFPKNEAKKSGSLALRLFAFATGVCILVMIFLWQIIPLPGDIVLVVCVGLAINYFFMRNMLVHRPDFLRMIVRYFLILLAIAAVWFLITQSLIVTTFVIPAICLLALVFDAVLIVVFRGMFVSGYAKYLLFDVALGLAPLVLVALGLTTWNVPAYASALTASILALALVVFARKRLIEEIRKLFSM